MSKDYRTPELTLKRHRIRGVFGEVLASGNLVTANVARPLFETGIEIAVLTKRRDHSPGGGNRRAYHDLPLRLQGKPT